MRQAPLAGKSVRNDFSDGWNNILQHYVFRENSPGCTIYFVAGAKGQ
jgi:hypothetical protein